MDAAAAAAEQSGNWRRFHLGYKERFQLDCCIALPNGKEVRVKQAPSAKPQQHQQRNKGGGSNNSLVDRHADPSLTGTTVWDGAVVLAQYLASTDSPLHQHRAAREAAAAAAARAGSSPTRAEQQPTPKQQEQSPTAPGAGDANAQGPRRGFTCLELGAGTGAVSLCLLAAGVVDNAVLTDIEDMLPHLRSNVQHNSRVLDPSRALVLPLQWGKVGDVEALPRLGREQLQQQQPQLQPQLEPPFDLIVGSDLIYYSYTNYTPHSRLLLQTLAQLAGPESLIVLALSTHHNEDEVHAFLTWAQEDWGFEVERVTRGIPAAYVVADVLVAQLRLRDAEQVARAAAGAADGTLRRKDEY